MSTYHTDHPDYWLSVDRAHSDAPADKAEPCCRVCGLAEPFASFEDCLTCAVAYEIHEEHGSTMPLWRRLHAGTEWLAAIEREYARQMQALAASPGIRLTVRQAS